MLIVWIHLGDTEISNPLSDLSIEMLDCAIYGFKITAVCNVTLSYICFFCKCSA